MLGDEFLKRLFLRFVILILCTALLLPYALCAPFEQNGSYSDVSPDMWSYETIQMLRDADVLPDTDMLHPYDQQSRAEFVSYLYSMDRALSRVSEGNPIEIFADVPMEHTYFEAVFWAQKHGIVNGVGEQMFAPDAPLTRESICTILIRYAEYAGIKLKMKQPLSQFVDSLRISDYARSAVAACQMAQIINGYNNGFFKPLSSISKEESIAVVARMYDAAVNPAEMHAKLVVTSAGAYDKQYEGFLPVPDPLVPESAAVDLSYFEKVAFVGDSVSLRLQYYCAATKALGNATFLCAGSLSASNALYPVGSATVHPSYQGKKMLVEECVAASGAQVVYIMLDINNISFGVDRAVADMLTLIDRIYALSPDVKIVIESVTPMAPTSTIISNRLNNDRIIEFNQKMKDVCLENGWYYVDIAAAVSDAEGYLISDYCSDNNGMGIHFTNAAAEVWVEYLKTHVPEPLK